MRAPRDQSEENRAQHAYTITLGAVLGQVGCLTIVLVLAALFGGLWLDNRFGTKPMITVALMIASIPINLVAMFWVVRTATARLQSNKSDPSAHAALQKTKEETQGGEET